MYKLAIVLFAALSVASAKPGALIASPAVAPLAYTAGLPAVAAYTTPVVAPVATSSQYIARNYNGIVAAPYVAAPYAAAPYAAAAYTAYPSYPYASAYSAYSAYPYASAAYVV